jgi:hypothetical protein
VQAGATHGPQTTFAQPTYPEYPRRPSIPQGHVDSPQLQSRSPSLGQGHMPSPQLWQGTHMHSTAISSPQLQAPFGAAGALPGVTDPARYSIPADNSGNFDAVLFPMTPFVNLQPTWYTRKECLNVLKTFQASCAVSPDHLRDGRRINVLRDAIDKQDWQYLVMHQYYCMFTFTPDLFPSDLRRLPGLPQALTILQDVLDLNEKLSLAVLSFFSNFPYSLDRIREKWPTGFYEQTQMFCSFVEHAPRYDQLKLTCETRRFPPVAWELAHYLGLGSATFQRLLFTACLRSIWRGVQSNTQQSLYEARAISIFQQTQASYSQRLAELGARRYSDPEELEGNRSDLNHWGLQLKQLVAEYEAVMRTQGHFVATPSAMLPHAQQQQTHQAQTVFHTTPQPLTALATTQQAMPRGRPRTGNQASAASRVLPPQQQQQPRTSQYHTPRLQQQQRQQPQNRGRQPRQPRQPVPLLPVSGWVQPQQRQPNPARFSLHQAHLRSPVLKAQSPASPLYHFMQGFFKPPARLLTAHKSVEKWSFTVNAEMARCIPAIALNAAGGADRIAVDAQSQTIRIRCIKWPGTEPPNEHVWATTDTSWIPYSYFTFNGTSLQQRRKVHHGKDLPIDVTGLVKEGENILEMSVNAQTTDTFYENFLVAIEYLGVISQVSLKKRLEQNRLTAQQVLADIQRKLNGNSEDDEVAIVESNLNITLFDPFSASKICDIPVRSRACLHNDCFDLDTFLETRRRKGDASVPDQWRCPICNVDARPQYLVVDGFLEEVKKVLDAQGRSNTRAIIVHQDGSWKLKAEVRDPNGVSDHGASEPPPTPVVANAAVPARSSIPAHAEIIDLSD